MNRTGMLTVRSGLDTKRMDTMAGALGTTYTNLMRASLAAFEALPLTAQREWLTKTYVRMGPKGGKR
jgi:hypothetical protein